MARFKSRQKTVKTPVTNLFVSESLLISAIRAISGKNLLNSCSSGKHSVHSFG
jgi:hypothetical protein